MVLCIAVLLKENAYGVIYPVRGFLFIAKTVQTKQIYPVRGFPCIRKQEEISGNKQKQTTLFSPSA